MKRTIQLLILLFLVFLLIESLKIYAKEGDTQTYDIKNYNSHEILDRCKFDLYSKPNEEYGRAYLLINKSTEKQIGVNGILEISPKTCDFFTFEQYGGIHKLVVYNSNFMKQWLWEGERKLQIFNSNFNIQSAKWLNAKLIRVVFMNQDNKSSFTGDIWC